MNVEIILGGPSVAEAPLASFCFLVIAILTLISLVPCTLKEGFKSQCLYIPFLALLLYLLYEIVLPYDPTLNYRFDVIFIYPMLIFILLCNLVRWCIVYYLVSKRHFDAKTILRIKVIQLIAVIPILLLSYVLGILFTNYLHRHGFFS